MLARLHTTLEEVLGTALALVVSAALLAGVSWSVRGLITAVAVTELPLMRVDAAGFVAARAPRGADALTGLERVSVALFSLVGGWLFVGLPVAEILTPGFDIDGAWSWLGTLAAVWAMRLLVSLHWLQRSRSDA